jgi:hypothetical protein
MAARIASIPMYYARARPLVIRTAVLTLGLMVRRFPRDGRVRLSIGPYAHAIDLYAPEPRAGFCEYRWSGQRWERHDLPCEHG